MKTHGLAAIAIALLAVGCQQEPEERNVTPAGNAAEEAPAANVATPVANVVAEAPAKLLLNLAPDGLTLVDSATGAARQVAFGGGQYATTQRIDQAIGSFTGQAENPECGAGPLTSFDYPGGLTLFFQEKKFVGWDFDGEGHYSTANGIGIGTKRAALDASGSAVEVQESSIGHEFAAGDLHGLLDSADANGKVTNLWAGITCIFR